jgi:hypothetical protein
MAIISFFAMRNNWSDEEADRITMRTLGFVVDTGRPGWRERRDRDRDAYAYERRGPGCRTVTIERDDGSMKRIKRCD